MPADGRGFASSRGYFKCLQLFELDIFSASTIRVSQWVSVEATHWQGYPCQHYSAGFVQPPHVHSGCTGAKPICIIEIALSWTGPRSHALPAKRHPRVSVTM